MNPALPVLIGLSLIGFFFKKKELGGAWIAIGMAGIFFLFPVLMVSDGIPSPAVAIGGVPPWEGLVGSSRGNSHLTDVSFEIQPWLILLRSQLRSGHLPFWNPHQFVGAPFLSNGQSAPFFPLHLLFTVLPLQLGFILLLWFRIFIAGCGAWALAREIGAGRIGALAAGLIFPLSGMISSFLLFPMANALCLVPWILWSVERVTSRKGKWTTLAILIGLQLLGGHIETVFHTMLLCCIYLVVRLGFKPLKVWGEFFIAGILGFAISCVQILPLAFNILESSRWNFQAVDSALSLKVILSLSLRLILPGLFGHPFDSSWWGPFDYGSSAVFVGLIGLPLAWGGLMLSIKDRRWRAIAVLLGFSLLAAYQMPGLKHLLLGTPIVSKVLHHRLLFGVDLMLAVLCALGFNLLSERKIRHVIFGSIGIIFFLSLSWCLFLPEWRVNGLVKEQLFWTCWAVCILFFFFLLSRIRSGFGRKMVMFLPLLIVVELTVAHVHTNPSLPKDKFYPLTPSIEFLQKKEGRIAAIGHTFRPNAAIIYGLYDIRGEDALKNMRYDSVYSKLAHFNPVAFEPITNWDNSILDELGVRWIIAPPLHQHNDLSWKIVFDGGDARIFERMTAKNLVRWAGRNSGRIAAERKSPSVWEIGWSSKVPDTIEVAESWVPGWAAYLDGKRIPIRPLNGILIGIDLPPGSGVIRLRYIPEGFVAGSLLSSVALLIVFFIIFGQKNLKPKPKEPDYSGKHDMAPQRPSFPSNSC